MNAFPRQLAWLIVILLAALALTAPLAAKPEPQWELWKINADGTGLARFADTPGYSCGSAQWSPDGRFVAYDTRRIPAALTDSQIAVINADGTGNRLLGKGGMPSWSPDGTHLVFHTYIVERATLKFMSSGNLRPPIVVMKADGTGREPLINHFGAPRWLADGAHIATAGEPTGITIFDLATGRERNILAMPRSVRPGFAFDKSGQRVVFGDAQGGLFLADLTAASGPVADRKLLDFGICYHASWSPDGKKVVFGWKRSPPPPIETTPEMPFQSFHQLLVIDVDSGGPPVPLAGQDATRNNTNPAWSPDGKTIIFSSQQPPEQKDTP